MRQTNFEVLTSSNITSRHILKVISCYPYLEIENSLTILDVNIEEEREPKSPLTAGLFRDEMVTNWVRRKSMEMGHGQLSGTTTLFSD